MTTLTKEEISLKLKENQIYESEKDTAFKSSEYFRKKMKEKYNLSNESISRLYVRILNYQVKCFGGNLAGAFLRDINVNRDDQHFRSKVKRS